MQPAPCPTHETLVAYTLGKLPAEQLQQVARHADDCRRCQAQLQTLDSMSDDLLVHLRRTVPPSATDAEPALSSLLPRLESLATDAKASASGSPSADGAESLPDLGIETRHILAPPERAGELGCLGSYRVQKILGAGGMGIVFQAEDPQLHRTVALKVMKPSGATHPNARQRFLREAQATAQVRNDHVVTVYQVGEDRGVPFLAMEFLEGGTLESFVRQLDQPAEPTIFPVDEILRIGVESADGLAAAHERGLVHRDIKPANIWLEKDGRVKIVDFGLARTAVEDQQLTQTGMVLGTPAYMSPEQANGRPTDARSDLFSLGCVLYQLCTGQLPFQGSTTFDILLAVVNEEPRPIVQLNPRVPKALVDLIGRLLAKQPDDRPATARTVRDSLQAMQRDLSAVSSSPRSIMPTNIEHAVSGLSLSRPMILGRPQRRSSAWLVSGVAGASLLAGGLAFYLLHNRGSAPTDRASSSSPTVAAVPTGPTTRTDGLADREFNSMVAKLRGVQQAKAVSERLKYLNPGFAGIAGHKEGGFGFTKQHPDGSFGIWMINFSSDAVADISPLAALAEMGNLTCAGSKPGLGKVHDLRPLKDLKLTTLDISCTDVKDLSPLTGMGSTLTRLYCHDTHVQDLTPLKALTELKELECDPPTTQRDVVILRLLPRLQRINGKTRGEFLDRVRVPRPAKP